MSSSSRQRGSSSEASSSWGVSSSPGVREGISGLSSCLKRLDEGELVDDNGVPRLVPAAEVVRFMAALQAFWRDFAVFSSFKAVLMASRGASAICWMLVDV